MYACVQNGVLRNGQQPQCCECVFDQGEFAAMKTLIGRRAPRCVKDQFRAKTTLSTSTVGKISLLNVVIVANARRMRKMALSLPHTFAFSCVSRGFCH